MKRHETILEIGKKATFLKVTNKLLFKCLSKFILTTEEDQEDGMFQQKTFPHTTFLHIENSYSL